MNQITKLQTRIQELEDEATKLNHSDTSGDYYKNLYTLLSEAYFATKDIIELQAPNVPLTVDKALEANLRDANSTIKSQAAEIEYLNGSLDRIREIIR